MPLPYLLLSLALQAVLIIHCIKTGRNQIWIWVLLMLSMVGVVAYVAAELIPELVRSRTTQRTVRGVKKAMDPEANLRRFEQLSRGSDNVDSRQRHAEELLRLQRPAEAISLCAEGLKGLYEHDPSLLLTLARAQYESGAAAAARVTLERLIEHNPNFNSPDGHLLFARALEAEGNTERALEEYRVLAGYYPGAEATVRWAQLLVNQSQAEAARTALQELLQRAEAAPQHYRRTQEAWLSQAKQMLA
ncbi:MAG: tetratricopeptide repeat protein [Proteobacteria bacterium]|nr:tetratricopeptide repeat protein [Pseudomonadota bacterium]